MNLNELIIDIFPDWRVTNELPSGLSHIETSGDAEIKSWTWDGDNVRRVRLCQFSVPGKFFAETLVIYPEEFCEAPIFGCEYLRIGGIKFFGGIDFHPLSQAETYLREYIDNYLDDMPDTSAETSKFYDLSTYFSKKFWLKTHSEDFYEEFYKQTGEYLIRYKQLLEEAEPTHSMWGLHKKYDLHMGTHDPARGILKAYFSKEFSDFYIEKFLFNLMSEPL
jgi:hypothetical protein